MKAKTISLFICCMLYIAAKAQLNQRFDNTNYKAIYFKEVCKLLANNPNLLLLDVRSPGEYKDSSQNIVYSIGRLKGSVNISIDSVKTHFNDLKAYKDRPILIYCSHSQRSRVVSKLLADSGFKNVYSLNGGMTQINRTTIADFPCKSSLYTSNLPYKLISADDAVIFIRDNSNVIIDVRPAAQFDGNDSAGYNNIGRIKRAINVPLSTIDKGMANLNKYKEHPILLYDLSGADAMQAAAKLYKAGFKNVNVLFEGFNGFLVNTLSSSKLRSELMIGTPAFKIIGVRETIDLVNQHPELVIADLRPGKEFGNKADQSWHNLGHIKNAVNFTTADLVTYLKGKDKRTPILIYGGFSSAVKPTQGPSNPDLTDICRQLASEGYSNVYLLYNGLYSAVWESANVESNTDAASILVDHAGLY